MSLISVDCGRDSVKAFDGQKEVVFPSWVGEHQELKLENPNQKYKVEINGEKFFIGELAKESYFAKQNVEESKAHVETRILILTACALLSKTEFKLVTTLPIDWFNRSQDIANILKGCVWNVTVNDNFKPIFLNKITFAPEGAGLFYNDAIKPGGMDQAFSGKVRVLDIGSRTINYLTMENYKYFAKESGTLDYGCIEFDNADIDNKEAFIRKIKADLQKKVHSWRATDKILVGGGGAIKFKNELMRTFADCRLSSNPVGGNAAGAWKMVNLWQA